MRGDRSLAKEMVIVAAGSIAGALTAVLAMIIFDGRVESFLSVMYAILMSVIYYIWFVVATLPQFIFYIFGCVATGFLLGLLEVSF